MSLSTRTTNPLQRNVIVRALLANVSDCVLLWQVACEFVAASRRLLVAGSDARVIWDRLEEIRAAFPLVAPTAHVPNHAREMHTRDGASFWDAMLYGACVDAGITLLYTEDLPGRRIEGLNFVNPFA